ncbi:MAG: transcription termination factor Rho [Lachnospiraceae bacterium]|nr:transcription termination factor Rho [Lachnospiraceae bacterium]
MREKLQSFTLTQLKEIAKSAGLKGIASLKKEELIERLVELDEKMQAQKAAEEKKAESKKASEEKKAEPKKAESAPAEGDKKSGEKKASSGKPSGKKNSSGRHAKGKEAPAEEKAPKAPVSEAKPASETKTAPEAKPAQEPAKKENVYNPQEGDEPANGILEVMPEGYGFIRCDNYLPGENDVYVSPAQIRKFGLRTGDVLDGVKKAKSPTEKFSPLIFLNEVNGYPLSEAMKRVAFENMTPIFPNSRIRMETDDEKNIAMRVMDLVSPVGKGQRGMIVSPPKAGKTTLLKSVAQSILYHNPDMHIIILLIDERPEEVTDMKEAIKGKHVEVIYSTFDEMPEHHARVSEMVIERARRLVEHGEDVVILLDSITRLARAYNQVIPPSGRTLSGGLDPAALHMPKRFFGAARNMREGGSLTILATALVETGSKMDDVVYEEFKGTGNMEMILDRKLSEKRIFPAVDLAKSGTRREDLLLTREELRAMEIARRALNGLKSDDAADRLLEEFKNTRSNAELVRNINVRNHV